MGLTFAVFVFLVTSERMSSLKVTFSRKLGNQGL